MKHAKLYIITLIIALVAGYVGSSLQGGGDGVVNTKESAYERVMRTGILRCGYYVFPPVTYRDQDNNLSGFSFDMIEEIVRRAGLKVEWAEEITFGNWVPAIQAKRFDAVCTPMWPEIASSRVAAFTEPFFYAGLSPLVRADDARFKDGDLERFNAPDVTFVTLEGDAIDELTRRNFPKAKLLAMPATTDGPTVVQEVVTGKADAILLDKNAEYMYNKNNTVKLKLVAQDKPLKVQPFTLVVGRDEVQLQDFFNNATHALLNDGTIDYLLDKWEPYPDTFMRVNAPYRKQ